jgi:very-short-patch-repair endonuclease
MAGRAAFGGGMMATRLANDPLPSKVRKALANAEWFAEQLWHNISPLVESPIELRLLEEIFADYVAIPCAGKTDGLYLLNCYEHGKERVISAHGIIVFPQAQVGSFRVDFLLDVLLPGEDRKLYAVECDGFEYHDRTREQATRDKRRDRLLQADGLTTIRFSGSEIFNNAEMVWRETVEHITGKRGPGWARLSERDHG